ncbi:DUF1684 domain-containing protein [Flindersiella endophytica]
MTLTHGELNVHDWEDWRARREASVSGVYGPMSLAGTHWLGKGAPTQVPGVPGEWLVADDGPTVRASLGDGLLADGVPVGGEVAVRPDTDSAPTSLSHGDWRLELIEREGEYAVRVYDPHTAARKAFAGIDTYAPQAEWVVPAWFVPFDESEVVGVRNADGKVRGLELAGELKFAYARAEYALQAEQNSDGDLKVVFSDASSGTETYRFRFLKVPEPDENGRTVLDFNRAYLPPCAFSEHFLCPFPPPGNALPFPVTAGEKQLLPG